MQSEQIDQLVTALAKCQGEMKPAIKESLNPHFKSKFANLTSVWEACREPLSKNGLAVIQTMEVNAEGQIIIITTLAHQSGQWIRSKLPVVSNRMDAQGIGSGLTYMKRYALSAIVGISTDEDDDGEKAMGRDIKPEKELMTVDQAKEIYAILNQCSPEFIESFWEGFKNCTPPVTTLTQVKKSSYDKIKAHVLKNRDEYLSSKSQENMNEC